MLSEEFFVCLAALVALVAAKTELVPLNAKNFQLEFLQSLADFAEQRAGQQLNAYLQHLAGGSLYSNYSDQLAAAQQTGELPSKVLLIKQLLDAEPVGTVQQDLEHTYVLRNLVFLRKLKQRMHELREASSQEMRQLRLHRLCKQFEHPTMRGRLINEQTVGAALEHLQRRQGNATSKVELNQFGHDLYERVKLTGAQIIDNYLQLLRDLLQDIIDEHSAGSDQHSAQLANVQSELDAMLQTDDFYEKRQRLYAYLERHLAVDYEQLRDDASAELHLRQLHEQLKRKGLDLFVIFLFSNFEFLEHVHEQWSLLLPQTAGLLNDETTRELHDIQQLYDRFKLDTESEPKYEAYAAALRRLHERTVEQGQRNRHIFEMLSNAAQNVGSVTFNMIKAKCKELL